MPYCTGDVHIGDNTVAYSSVDNQSGKVMEYKGTRNVLGTMGWLRSNLPRPAQVFLSGQSAGSLAVDLQRLPVRQILNPSDSLYTVADSGFITAEDPVNNDVANYPATNFIKAARKNWWGYDPAAPTPTPPLFKKLGAELPGFNPSNLSNLSQLISKKYPEDRMLFVDAQSDGTLSKYGYRENAAFQTAAIQSGDINLSAAPAHFSPLGNYLRSSWGKDLNLKIATFGDLGPNQGYFFPSGRRFNESHCLTLMTYEGSVNLDTGHTVVDAISNLIDRRRPPVFREKESDPTRGLYGPIGPNTQALVSVLGDEMLFPPLN